MIYQKDALLPDFQLALTYEMIEGKGEDSVLSVFDEKISLVGTFDGTSEYRFVSRKNRRSI